MCSRSRSSLHWQGKGARIRGESRRGVDEVVPKGSGGIVNPEADVAPFPDFYHHLAFPWLCEISSLVSYYVGRRPEAVSELL
jgi:hypothetical protein